MAARLLAAVAVVLWLGASPAAAQTQHRLYLAGESDANRQVSLTVSWVPDQRATEAVAPPAPTDFTVLENDKVVQGAEVARLPDDQLEVVLVIETRRDAEDFGYLMSAVPELVAGLPPTAKVAVVVAGDRPELIDEMAPVEGWSAAEALDGITQTGKSTVLEAFGLAADQFSEETEETGNSSRRRAVVVFAEGYQSDPATVSAEMTERIEDERIDTYVVGTARGFDDTRPFPLPLRAGIRLVEYGPGLPNGARQVADHLSNQYRTTFSTQAPKGPAKYNVRIGDEKSPLNGLALINLPGTRTAPERGASRLAVLVGVPVLIAAIVALLFVPPRIRAARAARSESPPVGVLQPVGTDGWPEPVVTSTSGPPSREGPAPETVSSRPMGVGGEQVEGLDAVRELLRVGRRPVRGVWMAEGVHDPLLVELAELAHVPIRRVGVDEFRAAVRSEYSGGVLALTSSIASTSVEQLCRPVGRRPVSIVVVYGPADPERLAGLARAAAASGFAGIVLAHGRTAPVSPAATALARGAMEHVRFSLVNNLPSSIARLKRLGCVVVGIDPGAGTELSELAIDLSEAPVALVVGAGGGLDRRLRGRCDVAANVARPAGAATPASAIAPLACAQLTALRTERSPARIDPRP